MKTWILIAVIGISNLCWYGAYRRLADRYASIAYHDMRTEAELDRAVHYIRTGKD